MRIPWGILKIRDKIIVKLSGKKIKIECIDIHVNMRKEKLSVPRYISLLLNNISLKIWYWQIIDISKH